MGALTPVPGGDLATIVTALTMTTRPARRALPPSPLRLAQWRAPASDTYRALFRRVGGPWLWYSRLVLPEPALRAVLDDPAVELFAAVDREGIEVGMVELDFRISGQCQIVYFGLIPELTGQGLGRWLMARTLAIAWRPGVTRVGVNTCTLDHPAALGLYRRAGFVAERRYVETFPDPRVTGVLPPDLGAHVPLLAGPPSR